LGNCKYCGKPAGFLRSKHAECWEQNQKHERVIQNGRDQIAAAIRHAVINSSDLSELEKTITEIEKSSFVPSSERKALLVNGWGSAVNMFLEDGILDTKEKKQLIEFKEHFALSQDDLSTNSALERVIQNGRDQIATAIMSAVKSSTNLSELDKTISEIEQSLFVPTSERKEFLIKGWENSVELFLEDGILDTTEEKRLVEFKEHFALAQEDLNRIGALERTTKSAILRDILAGKIPVQRMTIDGNMPINFQKGEQLIWAFQGSKFLEDKVRRQFVGGSQGVSVRVMKGVYYRVGAFKGHSVENTERVHVDTGLVVITTKNIYFAGPRKSVRIPYTKIVSFEPFDDGIGLMRDAATAKPQIFVTGDGWFTYNLVTNLSKL